MGVLLDESELPTKAMLHAYHVFEYTAFVITAIVVVLTMAVIVMSNTKGISKYRWYLIHGLVWSLFFDAMGTFIGAVTLFPLPCYFGVNAASKIASSSQIAYFFIGVSAVIGKIGSLTLQFEHRYYQTQPADSYYRFMCGHVKGSMEIVVRIGFILLLMVIVFVPFAIFFPDQQKERDLLASLDPLIARLIDEYPGLICFATGTDATKVLIAPSILLVLIPIAGALALHKIYSSICTEHFSVNTQRLQMMLFWSLVAQMGAFFGLMLLPGFLYVGGPLLGLRNLPRLTMYCFYPFLLHTATDCLMILYFIRPYRRFLIRHFFLLRSNSRSIESVHVVGLNRVQPKFSFSHS